MVAVVLPYLFVAQRRRIGVAGRKDPMLPGNGKENVDKECFTAEDKYQFAYQGKGEPLNTDKLEEYIRNPHKFNIKEAMDGVYINLLSVENESRAANDEVVVKSVYDPSPVCYTVPASNAFTGFTSTGQYSTNPSEWNVKGNWDRGWYFYTQANKTGNTLFFTLTGARDNGTAKMKFSSVYGSSWTTGIATPGRARFFVFEFNYISINKDNTKTDGMPVRSAEEKKRRCVVGSCNGLTSASSSPRVAWVPSIYAVMADTVTHCNTLQPHNKINALNGKI